MGGINAGLRTLFCHNPRTGGSAMEIALGLDHQHWTMEQIRANYGEEKWSTYFTFAFVRDPLARLISTYEFAKMERSWYHDNLSPGPQGTHGDSHVDFLTLQDRTLEDACRMLLADPDSLKQPGWKPQTHFISDPDGLDFIGRYENLAEDWKYVCRKLGVEIELPRINETTRTRDRSEYMTPFCVEFASRYYRADYAAFGYPLPLPIVPDAVPEKPPPMEFWPADLETRFTPAPVSSGKCCGG